jgi:hypothetical protein
VIFAPPGDGRFGSVHVLWPNGAVMVYEINEVKLPASWKTPREGFDEYSSKFSLS